MAEKATLCFADLAEETLVLYPRRPRPSYADQIIEICRHEGFEPRHMELAQDYQTAISLVSVGVGVSVVPASVRHATRPGVFFRDYEGFNPGTALTIHARLDNRASQVMHFFEITRKFARSWRDNAPRPGG